jgi:hypothetical protein
VITPRERAEAARKEAWDLARERSMSRGVEHHELIRALDECFAAAITEHVRAAVAQERERCARVVEAWDAQSDRWHDMPYHPERIKERVLVAIREEPK